MRPIWFFYAALGIIFTFALYILSMGEFTWWYMVYYIILAFLGLLGIYWPQPRWSFVVGIIIGVGALMFVYKYGYVTYDTSLFFLQRYIAPVM